MHIAAPCAPAVRPLWALLIALLCSALPVRPLLCNPRRNPLFWPLCHLGLFEIDLGYWSSKLKMSLGYWSSKRKRYWSSKWKMSLGYWSSPSFWPFCKVHWFFQRAGREGSDQKFFLPRVPKFKLDQTGWLHNLSFYTPFTQPQEITVKDLTIVAGHPVYNTNSKLSISHMSKILLIYDSLLTEIK